MDRFIRPSVENPLLVATVQHTGTHFALKTLGDLEQRPIREYEGNEPVAFAHLHDIEMDAINAWDGAILTTYRDPLDTMRSWLRRKRQLHEYYEQWRNWFLLLERGPMIIDITHRESFFFIEDWTPENSWRK